MARWLITLWLCLAIPLQGWSALRADCAPCPAHESAPADLAGAAAADDCCDPAAAGAHGCSGAPACHAAAVAVLPETTALTLSALSSAVEPRPAAPVRSGSLRLPWRPPWPPTTV